MSRVQTIQARIHARRAHIRNMHAAEGLTPYTRALLQSQARDVAMLAALQA